MTIREMAEGKMGKLTIICTVIGLVLVLGNGLVSCSRVANVGGIDANQAVANASDGVVENVDLPEPKQNLMTKTWMTVQGRKRSRAYSATKQQAMMKLRIPRALSRQGSTVKSKGNSTAPSQSTSEKNWVKETERIWVVDKKAWTDSVPIYNMAEVPICNICG